jgi:hypothetical protein
MVMPNVTTLAAAAPPTSVSATELAGIMRRMRPDLELEK